MDLKFKHKFKGQLKLFKNICGSRFRICAAQHCGSNAAALKANDNVDGTDRTEEWFAVYLNVSSFNLKMTCFVGFTVTCLCRINDVIREFRLPNNPDQASK